VFRHITTLGIHDFDEHVNGHKQVQPPASRQSNPRMSSGLAGVYFEYVIKGQLVASRQRLSLNPLAGGDGVAKLSVWERNFQLAGFSVHAQSKLVVLRRIRFNHMRELHTQCES